MFLYSLLRRDQKAFLVSGFAKASIAHNCGTQVLNNNEKLKTQCITSNYSYQNVFIIIMSGIPIYYPPSRKIIRQQTQKL